MTPLSVNLTSKVFGAYKYIYSNQNNYDWYIKADYDTFVFVDNLRKFLSDKHPLKPVTYGYGTVVREPIEADGKPEYLDSEICS